MQDHMMILISMALLKLHHSAGFTVVYNHWTGLLDSLYHGKFSTVMAFGAFLFAYICEITLVCLIWLILLVVQCHWTTNKINHIIGLSILKMHQMPLQCSIFHVRGSPVVQSSDCIQP